MNWHNLVGHRDVLHRFQSSVAHERLGSSFLFVGPEGVGKFHFARLLAQALLCKNNFPGQIEICGTCPACRQTSSGNHPDVMYVSRRADRSVLQLDQFIGDPDHRYETGLCHHMMLKPAPGGRKIGIINDADYFNQESANALLKLLEEPPPRSLLILIGTSRQAQLRTILSRCQVIPFAPLTTGEVAQILADLDTLTLPENTRFEDLAAASEGSVAQALWLAVGDRLEVRRQWLERLAIRDVWTNKGTDWINKFVTEASKDKQVHRELMHWLATLAIHFFRELLAWRQGQRFTRDNWLGELVRQAAPRWRGHDGLICDAIDRTVEFQDHVDANLTVLNSVEPWLSDLSKLAEGQTMALKT